MRILLKHTMRRHQCVFQQNLELNIVPWETLAVREKHALVKTASKSYRKNPTNTNARKLKIESCKPTRKSKTVETAFRKSTRKPTESNK